jgi:hypothetical protein
MGGSPDHAFETLENWIENAGLPRFSTMGGSQIDEIFIAEGAAVSSSMKGNPVKVPADRLAKLVKSVLCA